MKWRNLKVKCGSVISGREVPVGSECQFCILVLPTSIIVLHERSRKKTISEGKENRPWPFGDRSFQKKNRAFEGGWKQEPRRRCGTNRRIWLRMATDKIKVAVRVRPFNRRGKKKSFEYSWRNWFLVMLFARVSLTATCDLQQPTC